MLGYVMQWKLCKDRCCLVTLIVYCVCAIDILRQSKHIIFQWPVRHLSGYLPDFPC